MIHFLHKIFDQFQPFRGGNSTGIIQHNGFKYFRIRKMILFNLFRIDLGFQLYPQ